MMRRERVAPDLPHLLDARPRRRRLTDAPSRRCASAASTWWMKTSSSDGRIRSIEAAGFAGRGERPLDRRAGPRRRRGRRRGSGCRRPRSREPRAARRSPRGPRRPAARPPPARRSRRRPASARRPCRAPRGGRRGSGRGGGSTRPRRGSGWSRRRSRPSAAISSISRQKRRREIGSTPLVGSSRKTTRGRCSTAQASASRCFQPPGSSPVRRSSLPSSPAMSDGPGLALAGRGAAQAVDAAEEAEVLADGEVVVEAEALAHVADAALDALRVLRDVDAEDEPRRPRSARAGRTACGWSWTCRRRSRRGSRRSRPRSP